MSIAISLVLAFAIAAALPYAGRAWGGWGAGWAVPGWLVPLAWWSLTGGSWGLALAVLLWLAVAFVTGVPAIRRRLLTGPAMRQLAARFPRMGDTERIALEAGTVWWDAELFSGA